MTDMQQIEALKPIGEDEGDTITFPSMREYRNWQERKKDKKA